MTSSRGEIMILRLAFLLFLLLAVPAGATTAVGPRELPSAHGAEPLAAEFRSAQTLRQARSIAAPRPKALSEEQKPSLGAHRIGWSGRDELTRAHSRQARTLDWSPVAGGSVGTIRVSSAGAAALRVALDFGSLPPGSEVTVIGNVDAAGGFAPTRLTHDLVALARGAQGALVWTPVTSGEAQVVEVFVPGIAPDAAPQVVVADVSHLVENPLMRTLPGATRDVAPKLLACHENYSCMPAGTLRDAGRAVAKLVITTPEGTFNCSGALLTDRAGTGTPWFATAHHCGVTTAGVAASVQFIWYYEQQCSGSATNPAVATTVGSSLLFTDRSNDFTLLRLSGATPGGLVLLGWDSREIAIGTPVTGIHHPAGTFKKYSSGTVQDQPTVSAGTGADIQTVAANRVYWQLGLTEPGSSGSPLMTGGGHFVGTLFSSNRDKVCGAPNPSNYSRFSRVYARASAWLDPAAPAGDDWPDTPSGTFSSQSGAFDSTAQRGVLNSPGDQDWFRFGFVEPGIWLLYTDHYGSASDTDTIGRIYSASGTLLAENDDDPLGLVGFNFAFYNEVFVPGTFYLQVTGFSGATGPYALYSIFLPKDDHGDLLFLGTQLAANGSLPGSLSREGDLDAFIIDVPSAGLLTVSSSGSLDVMGGLYDASGAMIGFNDDAAFPTNLNFSLTRQVAGGRYYVAVVGYDPSSRGAYTVHSSFTAGAGPGPGPTSTAVEYFHQGMGHFFVTADANEVRILDTGNGGWARTGQSFRVFPLNTVGAVNVCRFFTAVFAPRSTHFYTGTECPTLRQNPIWTYEGEVFAFVVPSIAGACPAGTVALYRLYNRARNNAPNHRYTTSLAIRDQMLAQGWEAEGWGPLGVIACVPA
jgi:hypothetical protein